ncbi:unnamed protein product [Aphanomyces euteiches]
MSSAVAWVDDKYIVDSTRSSDDDCAVHIAGQSFASDSGFSFLETFDKSKATDDHSSWTARCCRVYSPMRMITVCVIVLAACCAAVFLGFVLQNEVKSPSVPGVLEPKAWDIFVYSLPNSCRVLSILGVAIVLLSYVLTPSFRFNTMPLIIPLLLSQLGYAASRLIITVSPIISYYLNEKKGSTLPTSAPGAVLANNCHVGVGTTSYCGIPSSILSTTFNLSQIAFTVAISFRLLQSVGAPVESLCDTRKMDQKMTWWTISIALTSTIAATTITLVTAPTKPPCVYNPTICTSAETELLNTVIAPAAGLATVMFIYFRIRSKIQGLYPRRARRTFKSVATYYIIVFVVTWGISIFLYVLLTALHELPDINAQVNQVWANLTLDEQAREKNKVEGMLLTFVPYDLQGFLTSVVAIWSFFRLRTRFDLGLSLKAINPASVAFDHPLDILGQGTFAVVVKATWFPARQVETCAPCCFKMRSDRGLRVAVKMFKLERSSKAHLNGIQEEAYLASKLVHPNIMATYGCYTVGTSLYLVCEYLGGGTLQDVLDTSSPLPYEQALLYALQIASGMEFLHGLAVPVVHRDLKPLNCCFDQTRSTLKLVDFGLSRLFRSETDPTATERRSFLPFLSSAGSRFSRMAVSDDPCISLLMTSRVGTVCWAAPEVLSDEDQTRYSLKVDVYSFGIICWQLITGKQPFSDIPGSVLAVEEAVLEGTRPPIPDDCPVHFAKLMRRAWHPKPDRRPSFRDIVSVLHAELELLRMYGTARRENAFDMTT